MCNQEKYLKLVKRLQYFENQGKLFYNESQEEYFELLHYEAKMQNSIYWKNRYLFLLLMKDFVNGIITGQEFSDRFIGLRLRLLNEYDNLITKLRSEKLKFFQPDPRSDNFGSVVGFLRAECDNFTDDYENPEFYNSIKNWFLKLQKALNRE